MMNSITQEAVDLLQRLIATPSVSRDEKDAADIMEDFLRTHAAGTVYREKNNVWIVDPDYDERRETVLLNAHIDTVKPVSTWTRKPFEPIVEGDCLYGLGSNDCGGGLVSLLQAYRLLTAAQRSRNYVYLASAEEEVSGADGFSRALPLLPHIDVAVVGEPTGMQPAIAEKGLMVVDGVAHGKSGHAARNEGINAIYKALDDLQWLRGYRFEKVSELLGATKATVTVVNAGTQHNVIPDECRFVIDVRTNELYTNKEVFDILCQHTSSDLKARSFRLGSSHISLSHPIVRRCVELGLRPFGSPTLSDQALMPFLSLKLGPGQSSRSHSADEYIRLDEMEQAIDIYMKVLGE